MGGRGSKSPSGGDARNKTADKLAGLRVDLEYAEMKYSEYAKAANYSNKAEIRDKMDAWNEERMRLRAQLDAASSTNRRVNKEVVSDWVDNQNAGNFLGDAPQTITVGGVKFNWIGDSTRTGSGGKEYINTYQASEQESNGEWPVIETVVKAVRRKGATRYVFDRSSTGTGLK